MVLVPLPKAPYTRRRVPVPVLSHATWKIWKTAFPFRSLVGAAAGDPTTQSGDYRTFRKSISFKLNERCSIEW